jgi:hypothetical protein
MRLQLQQQQDRARDEANAASQANQLTRLQLQLQWAQQGATAHILQRHQALNVLKDLTLDAEQIKKKQKMEKDLADACLELANAPPGHLDEIEQSLINLGPYPPVYAAAGAPRAGSGSVPASLQVRASAPTASC